MEEMTLGSFVKERITRVRQWKLLTKATSRLETTHKACFVMKRSGCQQSPSDSIRCLQRSAKRIVSQDPSVLKGSSTKKENHQLFREPWWNLFNPWCWSNNSWSYYWTGSHFLSFKHHSLQLKRVFASEGQEHSCQGPANAIVKRCQQSETFSSLQNITSWYMVGSACCCLPPSLILNWCQCHPASQHNGLGDITKDLWTNLFKTKSARKSFSFSLSV